MRIGIKNRDYIQIFRTDAELVLGDGGTVKFWYDNWLKEGVLKTRFPSSERACFESWMECKIQNCSRQRWGIAFFSIIWEVWNVRNNRIFRDRCTTVEEALDHIVMTRNKIWEQELILRKGLYKTKQVL
ncbi:hypothetical protein PIB30_001495 [Stylosanthes scabra]|uniref:Reverse transcriptase zinc-binding domain-containing protein n=1 Tax=Stylosanthes scabra TaxID=79078 RepID=A0ABU6Q3S9_9FABA|nr:hypothetical protein [Stylosanthes scabra]